MSIIGDLLVLLDMYKQLTLEEVYTYLPKRKKQTISSALGRLSSKGLLKKSTVNKGFLFTITREGSDFITESLKVLKSIQDKKHVNNWQIIVFNISEENRKYRDIFRRELIKHGFGRLQDSIWISIHDQSEEITNIAKRLRLENCITILFTEKLSPKKQIELSKKLFWDWKSINNYYSNFISDANVFLKDKNKSSYLARKLVYHYSQALQYDPKLPEELVSSTNMTYKAYALYLKIRPFCYSK